MHPIKIGIIAVLLVLSVFTAQAQLFDGRSGTGDAQGQLMLILNELDLTASQKQQLRILRQQLQKDRQAQKQQFQQTREWIKSNTELLMQQSEFDTTLAAEIAARRAELLQARDLQKLNMRFEIKNILTEEQRAKLRKEIRKRRLDDIS